MQKRKKYFEIPLDVYAEFAASFSPETMNFFVEKRRRVTAAICIQHSVRRHLARRNKDQENRFLLFRMLRRWLRRYTASLLLAAAVKSFISQSLLLFSRQQRAGETLSGAVLKYSAQFSLLHHLPAAPAYTPVTPPPVADTSLHELSVPQSPVSPLPARKPRFRTTTTSSESSDDVATPPLPPRAVTPRIPPSTRNPGPHSATRKGKVKDLRQKILLNLVVRLQALFRGHSVRQRLQLERQSAESAEMEFEKIKRAVLQAAAEREAAKQRLSNRSAAEKKNVSRPRQIVPVTEQLTPPILSPDLTSPAAPFQPALEPDQSLDPAVKTLAPVSVAPSEPTSNIIAEPIDEDPTTPIQTDTSGGGFFSSWFGGVFSSSISPETAAINLIKNISKTYLAQHDLLWRRADRLVHKAADSVRANHEDIRVTKPMVNSTAADVLLPQDVAGVLARGVIVDSASPLKGSSLAATTEWIVTDVSDTEVYEVHEERLSKAATTIQRFFRRYITKRKFLAYRVDKLEPPDSNGEDQQPTAEAEQLNTNGCVVM